MRSDPIEAQALAALSAWPAVRAAAARDGLEAHHSGHINDTFFVGRRFVLQRLNGHVFKRPDLVMANLAAALAHAEAAGAGSRLVAPLPAADGSASARDASGAVWRVLPRIPGRSFERLPSRLYAAAGRAFGDFLRLFSSCRAALEPVIDGFHDLRACLARYDAAVADSTTAGCGDIDHERRLVDSLRGRFRPGRPSQIIHGDCKVNNLLFHAHRDEVVAVIDLDTMMFGDAAWDFGDLVRSAAAGSEESEAPAAVEPATLAPLCRAFADAVGGVDDASRYGRAPAYMSFMLAVRFLTDHLQGDVYFRVARRGENLARARSQLALARGFDAASGAIAALLAESSAARRS